LVQRNRLREFIDNEAASAMPLLVAAIAALVLANSPFADAVDGLLRIRFGFSLGPLVLDKSVLLWINDGLMALFFLLVGLEIKREVVEGALSQPSQVALPVVGALGGMAVPALVYVAINWSDPSTLQGWATPAATDIAFSLGVLAHSAAACR
jgi:NhaA family Na+:H+ antiporter